MIGMSGCAQGCCIDPLDKADHALAFGQLPETAEHCALMANTVAGGFASSIDGFGTAG